MNLKLGTHYQKHINMNNTVLQLLISGYLGDGCLNKDGSMSFSSKHREYLNFKKELCPEVFTDIKECKNNGYSDSTLFTLRMKTSIMGKNFSRDPNSFIKLIDELGLALWLYDDGSLHKDSHFFNINSHSFTKNFQESVLIPILNNFKIFPKIMIERKFDGRVFHYLYVPKQKGVYTISNLLKKYKVDCYSYKIIPDTELLKWNYLVKRFNGFKISGKSLSNLINRSDFYTVIEKIYVTDNGFITTNRRAKLTYNKHTIEISSIFN